MERRLSASLRGEVRFDNGSRALYATDGSNYRQTPIGVVIPRDEKDVLETLRICRELGAPVLSRGGGTSLAGQCCNTAVIMDFSKYMNRVLEIDPERKLARVQPGVILDDLRHAAEQYNLTFGPDPATHNHCTLGGMIGNNSCGIHALMAGRTADNIQELDIVTYNGLRLRVGATSEEELDQIISQGGERGELYEKLRKLRDHYADLIRARYPKIPRRVSGYNLDNLLPENGFNVARALVGSEGTLVTVLEATVRLVPARAKRTLVVLGYSDVYEAGRHVPEVLKFGPIGLEGFDKNLIDFEKKKNLNAETLPELPSGRGWLMVEFGSDSQEESDLQARAMMTALKARPDSPSMKFFGDKDEEEKVWKIRESGLGATARVPGANDTWPGWEDSAIPPDRVGDYLIDLRELFNRYGLACALYGHFGQGCIHVRIDFDLITAEGIKKFREFMNDAADLVLSYGGSLSGEHGDGQARAELLPKMFGFELIEAFREYKSIWDPKWKMNPGKVIDPYKMDENLRLGEHYSPAQPVTHFKFPGDHGSMSHATLRCVGVGKCRRTQGGTMCPSFMVTREEKHSTRGRAHLLHEMFTGQTLKEGWKSEAVKDALDLCLSCKGCKGDCPVNVDMATYKAEFLSHYYEGRLRPRSAYAFGLINVWAIIASKMPRLVNFFTQTPGFSFVAKALSGMAPQRQIPKFAEQTFKALYRKRGTRNPLGQKIILWPDTFNNYFHPNTAMAAVEVLEAAGYQVIAPEMHLCCGRPLYDYGMLGLAKIYLRRVLSTLRSEIEAGVPIVGLEPSCVAVFRDELKEMLPNDLNAKRLSEQCFLLSEFLDQKAPDFRVPKLKRKALIHGHCHHKSVLKFKSENSILSKIGLDHEILDSGCCGMAGSFGFEKEKDRYEVSMKVGERVLLPAVRKAPADTLIVSDGFSCRTQIEQATDRKALHMAEVLAMALRQDQLSPKKFEIKDRRNKMQAKQSMFPSTPLYDVTSSFNQALSQARRERGEPDGGIARKVYDAKLWMNTNESQVRRISIAVVGVSLLGGIAAFVLRRRRTRLPEFPMPRVGIEESEINQKQKTA
ncbi:MAG: FAD-binding and (Fe-S)-binding domain-containing protein [Bdellovibrionia bacterium]